MWAGDGKSIFFMSDRERRREHLADGDGRRVHAAAGHAVHRRARAVAVDHGARPTRSCSSATSRIWKLDTASGKAAEVPITRMGAPAGPAVEHLRLTNQFQDLALSPDGKKVAFAARGEIFAASAKDGGDAARVTTTAAPESQVAWSPDSRRLVYSSERAGSRRGARLVALRLRDRQGDAADDRGRRRLRAAVFARRQVDRVRARRHRAARARRRRRRRSARSRRG